MRRRSGGEDGEVPGDVLAGWDARGIRVSSATAPESARDERHHCLPSAGGCSRSIHGCSAIDRSRLSSLGGTSVLLFEHACEVGVCKGVVVDVECQVTLRADLEVGAVALVADADD